jgi:hypothetical protein
MCQVDDFAVAAPNAKTSDMLMDLIDEKISIPIKQHGYLDMYNGANIYQTCHYINLNIKTFIVKVFKRHIATWIKTSDPTPNSSTPPPPQPNGSRNSTQQPVILTRRFKQHWLSGCNSHTVPASAN